MGEAPYKSPIRIHERMPMSRLQRLDAFTVKYLLSAHGRVT